MRCVAVLPEFFETEKWTIKVYEENGLDVYPVINRIGFSNPFLLAKAKLGFDMKKDLNRYWIRLSEHIENYCKTIKPDVLIVTQGMQLLPDAVDRLRKTCVTVLRMSDRISLFPELEERLKHYDLVYSYSIDEVDYIKSMGYEASHSFSGYDADVYFPLECKKDIDICFVGTMYKERVELLEKIASDFKDLNLAFYGKYTSPAHPGQYLSWVRGKNGLHAFKNKNLSREEVNQLYNRSKICLNINRQNMVNEWTPRIFEIMGTNSFQIVEGNARIDNKFHNCLCQYSGYSDLLKKIQHYLENEKERREIAQRGYNTAVSEYCSRLRTRFLLDEIKQKTAQILENECRKH